MRRLIWLLLLLAIAPAARATTYYVAADGADTASGSAAAPWRTLARVNSCTTLAAGDSVLLRRGDTWRETLVAPASGDSGQPIAFGAFGSGAAPVISGADTIPSDSWISLIEYNETGAGNLNLNNVATQARQAQEWIAAASCSVARVSVRLYRMGTIASGKSVWMEIWSDSGAAPDTVIAGGTSDTIAPSGCTTAVAGTLCAFTFASRPTLVSGARYYFVLRADYATSTSNYLKIVMLSGGTGRLTRCWRYTPWAVAVTAAWWLRVQVDTPTLWSTPLSHRPYVVLASDVRCTWASNTVYCSAARTWNYYADTVAPRLTLYATDTPSGIEVGARGYCFKTDSRSHLAITGLQLTAADTNGLYIGDTFTDVVVTGCTVSNCGRAGINLEALGRAGYSAIISRNVVHGCGYDFLRTLSGISAGIEVCHAVYGTIVERNESYSNLCGMELDQTSCTSIVRFNRSHNNGREGLQMDNTHGNLVHHNLLYANGSRGILLWHEAGDTNYGNAIYNNTISQNNVGLWCQDNTSGLKVKNNIFYENGSWGELFFASNKGRAGLDIDYNCYWNTAQASPFTTNSVEDPYWFTFAEWKSWLGQDLHSINADPQFVQP